MSDEIFKVDVNPELLNQYTLKPWAHLLEVEAKPYRGGRVIRSSLSNRCLDTFMFLSGYFYGEMFENTGGQAGVLDFIIPHYFTYRILLRLMKSDINTFLTILVIPVFLILGTINIFLSLLQKVVALSLFILSVPIILIVDTICNAKYNEQKESLKQLMIGVLNNERNEIPFENMFSPEPEAEDSINDVDQNADNFVEGKILSYKDIFSNLNTTTELVSNDDSLLIRVFPENKKEFSIRVDSENPEPLRSALYLNIFGITRSLEKSSPWVDGGGSDLHVVQAALAGFS